MIDCRDQFTARHPEQRQRLNGREWGLLRAGDTGPALLMLPGTLGRGDIFWQQIEALQGRARIMALSYPDSGSLTEWAGDIVALLRESDMQGAVILGTSMGGYLAQYLGATSAAPFSGLIAANTLPSVKGIDREMPYALNLNTIAPDALVHIFATGMANWTTPGHPYATLGALLLAEVKTRIPAPELIARLKALKHAPELPPPALPKAHSFIIDSGDDHLIPAAIRTMLAVRLPVRRHYHFETGSHFPYVIRPDTYTAILEEVLGLKPMGADAVVTL